MRHSRPKWNNSKDYSDCQNLDLRKGPTLVDASFERRIHESLEDALLRYAQIRRTQGFQRDKRWELSYAREDQRFGDVLHIEIFIEVHARRPKNTDLSKVYHLILCLIKGQAFVEEEASTWKPRDLRIVYAINCRSRGFFDVPREEIGLGLLDGKDPLHTACVDYLADAYATYTCHAFRMAWGPL
jgi:hypothetical protein